MTPSAILIAAKALAEVHAAFDLAADMALVNGE